MYPLSYGMLCSHFHLSQGIFQFPFRFLLWPNGCSRVCYSISTYLWIFLLLVISTFTPLWLVKILGVISVIISLLRLVLWTKWWPIPEKVPYALEKNPYSAAVRYRVLYLSVGFIWSTVLFKASVSVLTFSQVFHPLLKVGFGSLLLCLWLLPMSPFSSANVCFTHLGALKLATDAFVIVISCWWTDPFIIT